MLNSFSPASVNKYTVYNAMMTAFHNLLYPYRAVDKMF